MYSDFKMVSDCTANIQINDPDSGASTISHHQPTHIQRWKKNSESNIWFQFLKCQDLLLSFVVYEKEAM